MKKRAAPSFKAKTDCGHGNPSLRGNVCTVVRVKMLARASILGIVLLLTAVGAALMQLQRSPYVTNQRIAPDQPVPFSHQDRMAGLGLDCRYCHTSVGESRFAGIPPTKTCMNCHAQIWTNAALLEPARASFRTGQISAMDTGPRFAGLRVFQSQHPCKQRRRLLQLPWPGRPDAAHVPGEFPANGVVPELPLRAGKVSETQREGI